jgi:site-specific DNA recombinase
VHCSAKQSYFEEGIMLLELSRRAARLFESQPEREKRKLLNFVLSNCTWKSGELVVRYRQPFDALAVAVAAEDRVGTTAVSETARNENWLPGMDSNHELDTILMSRNLLILQSR